MFVGCHCYQRQVFAVVLTLQMILTSSLGKIQQVGAPKQLWKTHAPCFYIRLVITRVMNMQLWQYFSRAKLFRLKKARFCLALFDFQKKPKAFKKCQNFQIWLQKSQIGNPAKMLLHYAHSHHCSTTHFSAKMLFTTLTALQDVNRVCCHFSCFAARSSSFLSDC